MLICSGSMAPRAMYRRSRPVVSLMNLPLAYPHMTWIPPLSMHQASLRFTPQAQETPWVLLILKSQ